MNNDKSHKGYIPGIDGLRALAVLSVIIFHFKASLLPGGFSGVDVFFVISGYVVSSSLAKAQDSGFWKFTIDFYSRRILRIYPALVICLIITVLLQSLLIPPSWLSNSTIKTGIAAFFGLSNFALIWFGDGYFSPRVEFNSFTHTWSLAVEEQFYLLFPLIFFIWLRWRNQKNLRGIFSNSLLALLFISSLLISWQQTGTKPDHAYYLLPSRFWELAGGALLFKLHANKYLIFKSKATIDACIIIGISLITIGFVFSDPSAFPFPWAIVPVLGSGLIIVGVVSAARNKSTAERLLNNSPMIYIGKISYSLYLWHWPVAVIFRWTVGLENTLYILIAAALTAVMSSLSYHCIENSIRKITVIGSLSNGQIVTRGVTCILLCTLTALGIFKMQPLLSMSVTKDTRNWYPYQDSQQDARSSSDRAVQLFTGKTMFVLGDSHTGAYSTMLGMLEKEHGATVRQFSKGGCAVANLLTDSSPECARFIEESIAAIKTQAKPGDIVFLASLRMNRLSDQWSTFEDSEVAQKQYGASSQANRAIALLQAERIIEAFEASALTVVIDAPKPVFKSPPFRCSDWFNSQNPVCKAGHQMSRAFLLQHRQPVMASLTELNNKHPKLVVWDPFPVLCPTATCNAKDQNLPIFFDSDHLSGHGNRLLYPSFLTLIKTIWTKN